MEENKIEIRYAQPQKTTHFMNRKITIPRKSLNGEELPQNTSVNEADAEDNNNLSSAKKGVTES